MSDKLVWSNTMTQDFMSDLPEEDLRAELVDYGYEPEMLDGLDYEGLKQLVWDDDGMWQMDSEQFENEIRPMIERQTGDGIVLMAGTAGTWQGNFGAGRAVYAEDLLGGDICNDCDQIAIYDVDGNLVWTGAHHDGTHNMGLYKLPDLETEEDLAVDFITACMPGAIEDEMDFNDELTEEDAIFNVMLEIKQQGPDYINDYCDFSKVPEVCEPIKASVNESLTEDTGDRIVTTKPFSADNVIEITDYYPSIEIINAGKGIYQLKGPKADIMDAIWEFLADDHKMSDFFDSVAGAKEGLEEGCAEDECAAKGEDPAEVAMENGEDPNSNLPDDVDEGCELDEAKSQDPEALSTELENLQADYDDFGPEGMYAVTFDSFEREYPEFTKSCIKTFLKELDILEPEELEDEDLLNEYWQTGELIQPDDWPALFEGAGKLINGKGLQWEKIWKKYYRSPIEDKEATEK